MRTGSACDFASDYEIGQSPLMLEIEELVRGSAYGATSWTTRTQAEAAAARLGLATGRCLLELGGGSGWPRYFSRRCRAARSWSPIYHCRDCA
jgi:hypothetical protein